MGLLNYFPDLTFRHLIPQDLSVLCLSELYIHFFLRGKKKCSNIFLHFFMPHSQLCRPHSEQMTFLPTLLKKQRPSGTTSIIFPPLHLSPCFALGNFLWLKQEVEKQEPISFILFLLCRTPLEIPLWGLRLCASQFCSSKVV